MSTYLSIRQLAETGLVSEHLLRLMEKQGRLHGIYSGRKKLVNLELLEEQLREESAGVNQ